MATTLINSGHDVEEEQFEPDAILHEHNQTEQAHRHELALSMLNITTNLSWFIDDTWTLELSVPVRLVESEATFLGPEGQLLPGFGSIHHRSETLVGLSDITIQGLWSHNKALESNGRFSASLSLGLSLPTGDTEPNPDALGKAGLRHQHIFFGRGTFAPVVGGSVSLYKTHIGMEAWFNSVFPVYENDFGYRANRDFAGGISVTHSLGLETWRVGALIDVHHDSAAYWDGEPQRNSGRTDLILGAKASWLWASQSIAILELKRPVYTKTNGGQLSIPVMLSLGIGHSIL